MNWHRGKRLVLSLALFLIISLTGGSTATTNGQTEYPPCKSQAATVCFNDVIITGMGSCSPYSRIGLFVTCNRTVQVRARSLGEK